MPGSAPGVAEERALFSPVFVNTRFETIARRVAPPQTGWAPETDLPATQECISAYRGLVAAQGRASAPGWGVGGEGGSRLERPAKRLLLCGPTRSKLTPISKTIEV